MRNSLVIYDQKIEVENCQVQYFHSYDAPASLVIVTGFKNDLLN